MNIYVRVALAVAFGMTFGLLLDNIFVALGMYLFAWLMLGAKK